MALMADVELGLELELELGPDLATGAKSERQPPLPHRRGAMLPFVSHRILTRFNDPVRVSTGCRSPLGRQWSFI